MTLIKTSILSLKSPTTSKSLYGDLSYHVDFLAPLIKIEKGHNYINNWRKIDLSTFKTLS